MGTRGVSPNHRLVRTRLKVYKVQGEPDSAQSDAPVWTISLNGITYVAVEELN